MKRIGTTLKVKHPIGKPYQGLDVRKTFAFEPRKVDALEAWAISFGKKLSAAVRDAVDEFIANHNIPLKPKE